MRRTLLLLLVALLATGAAVAAFVLLDEEDDGSGGPAEEPFAVTPLADVDTTALTVPRASFCDRVDPREVEAALDGEPAETDGYDNGERVALTGRVTDVAHEFGCRWTAADGAVAAAWVFAPPVDAKAARRLAREARRTGGCEPGDDAPAYGDPSVALTCAGRPDAGASASWRGLFGDAWLTCEVTDADPALEPDDLGARADGWCSAVARAASATTAVPDAA